MEQILPEPIGSLSFEKTSYLDALQVITNCSILFLLFPALYSKHLIY